MAEKKKIRVRSPKYPSIDLEQAIQLASRLYQKEGFHRVPPDVAAEDMGYTAKSGSGNRSISALRQFGLLDSQGSGEDRSVWLSGLAKDILLDKRDVSPERDHAIETAALSPTIYRDLFEKYGSDMPSDAAIETLLLKQLNFNPRAVERFIAAMRATFEFAGITKGDDTAEDSQLSRVTGRGVKSDAQNAIQRSRKPSDSAQGQLQDLTIPLIGGEIAILSVPLPLSQQNLDHLVNMIEAMGVALVSPTDSHEFEQET